MKHTLPIRAAVQFGWDNFKAKPGLWIGTTLLSVVVSYFPITIELITDHWLLIALANVLSTALSLLLALGLIHVTLKARRREIIMWSDLWSQTQLLFKYFLGNIIYGLAVFLGLLLFIIPGVIIALRLFYFSYFMVDQQCVMMDAFKASWRLTRGWTGQLLLLSVVQTAIFLLGGITFGVGILVAIPIIILAEAYVYIFLHLQENEVSCRVEPYASTKTTPF